MSLKRNCIWYDETKRENDSLCYHNFLMDKCIFISDCPKNCGSYKHKDEVEREMRELANS